MAQATSRHGPGPIISPPGAEQAGRATHHRSRLRSTTVISAAVSRGAVPASAFDATSAGRKTGASSWGHSPLRRISRRRWQMCRRVASWRRNTSATVQPSMPTSARTSNLRPSGNRRCRSMPCSPAADDVFTAVNDDMAQHLGTIRSRRFKPGGCDPLFGRRSDHRGRSHAARRRLDRLRIGMRLAVFRHLRICFALAGRSNRVG